MTERKMLEPLAVPCRWAAVVNVVISNAWQFLFSAFSFFLDSFFFVGSAGMS